MIYFIVGLFFPQGLETGGEKYFKAWRGRVIWLVHKSYSNNLLLLNHFAFPYLNFYVILRINRPITNRDHGKRTK